MASRDELIEQFARDLVGGGAPTIPARQLAELMVTDKGWRPPPSGDVILAVTQTIAAMCTGRKWRDLTPRLIAEGIADAGYLATPVQQDTDLERGRQLASERDDLIAAGVDPTELEVPLAPRVFVDGREVPGEVVETLDQEWLSIPIPPDAETVERAAREAFWTDDVGGHHTPGSRPHTWENIPEEGRENYRTLIRAVIRALSGEVDTDG